MGTTTAMEGHDPQPSAEAGHEQGAQGHGVQTLLD